MYLEHFGLDTFPFKITPDPAFLCPNSQNRRALSLLRSEIAERSPFVMVTGEVGTGKTTLIRHVLDQASDTLTIGLLSNFPGWADDILPWVLYAFDIPDEKDAVARMEAFEAFVCYEHSAGRTSVLIVDEAQNVSGAGLEQLRRLANVNTGKDLRFIVILVGQPELQALMQTPECKALAQRIGMSATIGPMSAEETRSYIHHRLTIAGGRPEIIDPAAIAVIHEISGGLPRLVNVLCDTALVMAYASGDKVVGKGIIAGLGESDTILSHLPAMEANAHTDPSVQTSSSGAPGSSHEPRGLGNYLFEPDAFDFFPVPRRVGPDVDVSTLGATPVPSTQPVREAETPRPGNRVPRRHSPRKRTPANRIGLARVFGGTLLGGSVAAGAIFFAPLALHHDETTVPPEIVAMQSVAALGPISLPPAESERAATPLQDMTGAALLDRALAVGVTDPSAAAVDYARAAVRGEALAAYYLGQLYETGDGVTQDLARARSWYASVEQSVRGARRRLGDLAPPVRSGELAPPVPLLGGPLDTGGAEFVWASGEGADPAFFVVELSDGPVSTLRRLPPQELSALKVDDIGDARFWRVFAVAPDMQSYAVSDWTALGAYGPDVASGSVAVLPEAVVQMPESAAPERLATVTEILDASRIPYRVETSGAGPAQDLQIGYFFEADATAAREIADAVGAGAPVMLVATAGPVRTAPFPGQVLIQPASR